MIDNQLNAYCSRLSVLSFAIAMGIVEGLAMLGLGIVAWHFNYGINFVHQLTNIYYGFSPTLLGSLIGAVWGLGVGFVFGGLLAWIYNICLKCTHCRS